MREHQSRLPFDVDDLIIVQAVAESLSFRKAAARINIRPSAVSRRMRALEDRLGASLFERSTSGIRLTNAGRQFHRDIREAISTLDGAVRSAATAGQAASGTVTIGFLGSLSSSLLDQLVRSFRANHPNVELSLVEGGFEEHITAFANHSIDLAFVVSPSELKEYDSEVVWSEPLAIALNSEDARARQETLDPGSLYNDKFIVSYGSPSPEVHALIIKMISGEALQPSITSHKVEREALMLMVGLGFGASLVCTSEGHLTYPHVSFVPLKGSSIEFSVVWSPRNDNPALRRFLSLARTLSREKRKTVAASRTLDPSP